MTRYPAPTLPADSCSLPVDENLPGTAATETRWVLLEHPAIWGKDVLDGSAFGTELSAALKQKMADAGARLLLIRQPGRQGQQTAGARRAFVAETGSGFEPGRLFAFEVAGPEELLTLPLENPENIGGAVVSRGTLTLVCTHSKRDRCCALRGRPLAAFLAEELGDGSVWECSHTGGHRFAPVSLLMPSGLTYGRLTYESALRAALAVRQGGVELTGLRGCSALGGAEQAADIAVRAELARQGEQAGISDLAVEFQGQQGEHHSLEVRHRDNRSWLVKLVKTDLEPRPASCGKEPVAAASWAVLSLTAR